MNLLELYKKESTVSGVPVIAMAMISGAANAVLLAIINSAISVVSHDSLNLRYFILFVTAFLIFFTGKRYSLSKATVIAENIIKGVRVRIADKIRHSELLHVEDVGKSEFYTRLTLDTNLISQSALLIINACQSAIMLFFCLLYIATLSKLAFIIIIICLGAGISIYLYTETITAQELHEATEKETKFFSLLEHILDGFKEIKVNRKKSNNLFFFFKKLAKETEKLKIKTGLRFVLQIMFSQVAFYLMIAMIIFVLPRLGEGYSELIIRIIAAILFIAGPVDMLVSSIPAFARANVAVEHIYELEEDLDKSRKAFNNMEDRIPARKIASFNEIKFENISFSYTDKDGMSLFTVGPADLSIKAGEILFIIGGNGSGKSTFLKLLTGLYYPTSGTIKLDDLDLNVDKMAYPAYRELFSAIFSDFHLFDRLYGLDIIDYNKIDKLLKLMDLDKKTAVVDGKFTDINLSTGQRKRLAMLVALLDDRPIYVFDEWAADQDPVFREYYYNVLLNELKDQGKTIIAASHDDRYFHVADRILKMEFGQFAT